MTFAAIPKARWLIGPTCSLIIALTACTVCTEQIVDETTSPDRAWTTRTTVRDCGRFATPSTNIYLQRADSRARLGEIVVLLRHNHQVKIVWTGRAQIRIECSGCADDVRLTRPNVHGISIVVTR